MTALRSISLFVLLSGLLVGCGTNAPAGDRDNAPIPSALDAEVTRTHWTYPLIAAHAQTTPHPRPRDTWFDFQNQSPIEYLEFVAKMGTKPKVPNNPWETMFVFGEVHKGWVQKGDLPALIARIDDERAAPAWMLETCSIIPNKPSTVGDHAIALIYGFHSEQTESGYGGFPPSLSSDFMADIDRSALEAYLEEE